MLADILYRLHRYETFAIISFQINAIFAQQSKTSHQKRFGVGKRPQLKKYIPGRSYFHMLPYHLIKFYQYNKSYSTDYNLQFAIACLYVIVQTGASAGKTPLKLQSRIAVRLDKQFRIPCRHLHLSAIFSDGDLKLLSLYVIMIALYCT